jgi:hypothetical protein
MIRGKAIMIVACLAFDCAGQGTNPMATAGNPKEAPPLAADLVPLISDPAISMIVASVERVQSTTRNEGGLPVETGWVALRVVDVINSPVLYRGTTIQIPFKRIADRSRVKDIRDAWNSLPLQQGTLLLLACSQVSGTWIGRAGRSLSGLNDPLIAAARQCYAIERMPIAQPEKRDQLEAALGAQQDLLVFYALDALGRRSLFGRETGAATVGRAIVSQSIPPEEKLELANYLTRSYFFAAQYLADRANAIVLAAISRGLVDDSDTERQFEWFENLRSCIFDFSEPEEVIARRELIRSVRTPPPEQVVAILTELRKKAEDADEKADLADVIKEWSADHGLR